jgi:membrane-bound serine protease (ClpP class)
MPHATIVAMIPPSLIGRHRAARQQSAAAGSARRRWGLLLLLAGLCLGLLPTTAGAQDSATPLVEVVEVEGVIDRTVADYLRDTIEQAAADGAEVVVLSLDTPGGLNVSMDEIVDTITGSAVPVVVWVGPSGAQATSAGMYVAYAAHLLAMAPSTTIGAAAPADLAAGELGEAGDTAAEGELVDLAQLRGRDADFARRAVRDGAVVAIGDAEALPPDAELPRGIEPQDVTVVSAAELASRPVADFVAASLPDVLAALDGRAVELTGADGTTTEVTLAVDQETATVRFNNMGLGRRILHTVANPTLAYLLLIGGALTLLFEVFQPGFGVAGVTGVVLVGLALYALAVLPVNWLALALVALGLALLAADLAIAGLGALTAGGAVALAVGSLLLFSGADALRLSPWLVAGVVAFNLLFFVVIMTTVLRSQGNQALLGAEGMEGEVGVVRSMLNPEGHIFVKGALWRARAPESAGRVATGTKVRVLGLNDRLTLDVEVIDERDGAADARSTVG